MNRFARNDVVLTVVVCFDPVTVNALMVLGGFVFTMASQAMVAVLCTHLPEPPGHRCGARVRGSSMVSPARPGSAASAGAGVFTGLASPLLFGYPSVPLPRAGHLRRAHHEPST
ncbi:hypothetical protein [Streptomyces sp. A30]|uniref:hypothetical protein n=1 Tax=Streptomyces sp. A30 TaxID=2789273 RepID=UPI00397F535C